jgi:hypothetical protein
MNFFKKNNSDINKNIKDFIEVNNIIYKLKSKRFILGESEAQEKGQENLEDNQ